MIFMKNSRFFCRIFFKIVFLSCIFCFFGCKVDEDSFWGGETNVNTRFSKIKNLSEEDSSVKALSETGGKYQIILFTDVHKGAGFYKSGVDEKFFAWLSEADFSKIKFALALGDFADSGKRSEMKAYAEFYSKIEEKGIKVFNVIGNHDLYSSDGYDAFSDYCYPYTSSYKFYTKNFVWYALDSGSGTLGSKQLKSLETEIALESKTPLVFTHVPLQSGIDDFELRFSLRDLTERNILIKLFSENKVLCYFCGHYHPGGRKTYGNFTQYNFKSFGEFGKWYLIDVDEDAPSVTVSELG